MSTGIEVSKKGEVLGSQSWITQPIIITDDEPLKGVLPRSEERSHCLNLEWGSSNTDLHTDDSVPPALTPWFTRVWSSED